MGQHLSTVFCQGEDAEEEDEAPILLPGHGLSGKLLGLQWRATHVRAGCTQTGGCGCPTTNLTLNLASLVPKAPPSYSVAPLHLHFFSLPPEQPLCPSFASLPRSSPQGLWGSVTAPHLAEPCACPKGLQGLNLPWGLLDFAGTTTRCPSAASSACGRPWPCWWSW